MPTDYYELLGVSRHASADEIRSAYRQRARALHPDANPGDVDAEARFKELARAYETLSDPERRRRYDTFGTDDAVADPFGGAGLGDIFDAFFGGGQPVRRPVSGPGSSAGRRRPRDVGTDRPRASGVRGRGFHRGAHRGRLRDVRGHRAAPRHPLERCTECDGRGQVRRVRQSILGQMVTAGPCPRCHGLGEIITSACPDCRGEGRRSEEHLHGRHPRRRRRRLHPPLSGRGAAAPVAVRRRPLRAPAGARPTTASSRQGNDLVHRAAPARDPGRPRRPPRYETLDGTEDLVIPRGTQPGEVFRLRGRGSPTSRAGAAATCWCRWSSTRPPTSPRRRRTCCVGSPRCGARHADRPRPADASGFKYRAGPLRLP